MGVNPIGSYLRFVDQPLLLKRLNSYVPAILMTTGVGYVAYDTYTATPRERRKRFIKSMSVMTAAIAAGWFATRKIRRYEAPDVRAGIAEVLKELGAAKTPAGNTASLTLAREWVEKSKTRILGLREIHRLRKALAEIYPKGKDTDKARALLGKLIPEPEAHSWKEILGEIGSLSLFAAFPVVGGVLGGIVGNKLNGENWRKALKNQSKEALYQFLANIVLCNVGAGLALMGVEATPWRKSRYARLGAMVGGILAVGVLGGSVIANFFGKNCFNPLFEGGFSHMKADFKTNFKQDGWKCLFKDLNKERHPEPLDIALHLDDMAIVALLSGWKWIEVLLALLYTISAFRAGEGYRNGKTITSLRCLPSRIPHSDATARPRQRQPHTPVPTAHWPQAYPVRPYAVPWASSGTS